jgi:hypothetical protein
MGARLEPNNKRLQDILGFIVAYKNTHDGIAPSMAEIGAATGHDPALVRYYLKAMHRLEMIRLLGNGKARAIVVPGAQVAPA